MKQGKILIVDDEQYVIMMLKARLEANGFEVISACDGNEGLAKVKSEKPDLIILDIRMPNKDGRAFLNDFNADESLKRSIPVIILTADEHIADLYKMDRNLECIFKPFKPEQLIEKIRLYIQKKD